MFYVGGMASGVCVTSHINDSRHTWMSHVSHGTLRKWVTAHLNESCESRHTSYVSHGTLEWVMTHSIMTHSRVPWLIQVWRAACIRVSHDSFTCAVTPMNRGTLVWVMLHVNVTQVVFDVHLHGGMTSFVCVTLHINESRHLWIRYVPCKWVMSHVNASCHIRMLDLPYEWVMSHINEMLHMNESCHISMMSHSNALCPIWMSHVMYEWVMSHMNQSCRTDHDRCRQSA